MRCLNSLGRLQIQPAPQKFRAPPAHWIELPAGNSVAPVCRTRRACRKEPLACASKLRCGAVHVALGRLHLLRALDQIVLKSEGRHVLSAPQPKTVLLTANRRWCRADPIEAMRSIAVLPCRRNSRPSQTVATRTNFEQAITGRCQERNCSAEKLPAANSFCIRTDCARFSKGAVGSGSSCCRQMKVQAQFQRKLPAGNLSSATHWLYPPPVRVQTIRSIDRLRSNSLGTAQRRLSGTLSAGIVPQG